MESAPAPSPSLTDEVAAETPPEVAELPTDFTEEDYLAENPDVAAAVAAGQLPSGAHHYRHYGYLEFRSIYHGVRPPPPKLPFPSGTRATRRDKVLADLDLTTASGVEIGALAAPIVKRAEGSIFYVDHTDTETLKRNFAADPAVKVEDIVDVDAVWGAQSLTECVEGRTFDYVVASHVIEHVPDLIGWLAEIQSILKADGELRLVIPDKRYTFDYLRFETRMHDVMDAYLQKARVPLPRLIIEFCSLTRIVDCAAAWRGDLDVANLQPMGTAQFGIKLAENVLRDKTYYDTHCWVFTPLSFAELCLELARLDLLNFKYTHYFDTERNQLEFIVHMISSDDRSEVLDSWTSMRDAVTAQLALAAG